eukprot:m.140052 g.140052  ORF g.140052 m.140052 type:complete len:82 (-) comp30099_c0_seq1:143-388(-)
MLPNENFLSSGKQRHSRDYYTTSLHRCVFNGGCSYNRPSVTRYSLSLCERRRVLIAIVVLVSHVMKTVHATQAKHTRGYIR